MCLGILQGDGCLWFCFRNGSLAREWVRDEFGLDWDEFSGVMLAGDVAGSGGDFGFAVCGG